MPEPVTTMPHPAGPGAVVLRSNAVNKLNEITMLAQFNRRRRPESVSWAALRPRWLDGRRSGADDRQCDGIKPYVGRSTQT
jgi:hypothetical protein